MTHQSVQTTTLTRVAHSGNEEALVDMATTCPASELEARLREMENGGALTASGARSTG